MQISPISVAQRMQNFGCAKCDEVKTIICDDVKNEDKIATYASWGDNYTYPVYQSQIEMYEQNAKKYQEELAKKTDIAELQGETLPEYLERHKLEWSM